MHASYCLDRYTNSPRFLGNRYVHLTNYSINRQNANYVFNASEETCIGHKWSLRAFWAHLRSLNVQPEPVWTSIKEVIVKTCIATEQHLKTAVDTYCKTSYSVQELFGFDIFLDEKLKPWVLEVNVSPSMHIDSPLDLKVKGTVVKDMLNLTGLNLPPSKDLSYRSVRSSSVTPAYGEPRQPRYHLKTNEDSDDFHTSTNASSDSNEPIQSTNEVDNPSAPPHSWSLDRRVTIPKLSDNEYKKQEYYRLRAIEATQLDFVKTAPLSSTIQPEIKLNRKHLSPLIASEEATPTRISQGAGADSLDLATFIKVQETHKRSMEQKRLERKQSLHRTITVAIGEYEISYACYSGEEKKRVVQKGITNWERDMKKEDIHNSVLPVKSKSTYNPSELEKFRWVVENIFDFITPFDLCCLVQALDTKNRAGSFQSVFPAKSASKTSSYLRFFDKPRYANLLIFAYLDKYGESKEGIKILSDLCEKEVHLKPYIFGYTLDESNVWKQPISSSQKSSSENGIKRNATFS